MSDNRINNTVKRWYLQKWAVDTQYLKHQHEFWDTYLHADCTLIKESDKNPMEAFNG